MEYIAQVRTSGGRVNYQTKPHETREAARDDAFRAVSAAKSCTTGYGYNGCLDIRWHRREESTFTYPYRRDSETGLTTATQA